MKNKKVTLKSIVKQHIHDICNNLDIQIKYRNIARALLSLGIIYNREIPAMGLDYRHDKITIEINPEFINQHSEHDIQFCLMHEAFHYLRDIENIGEGRSNRRNKIETVVEEIIINSILEDLVFSQEFIDKVTFKYIRKPIEYNGSLDKQELIKWIRTKKNIHNIKNFSKNTRFILTYEDWLDWL